MSFLKKIHAHYQIITAEAKIEYTVNIGMFDHAGKSSAEWKSFKTAKGVLSDASSVEQIQKIADTYFPIFKEKKLDIDPKSCHLSVDGNVLDFIYYPKGKDIYAEITFIFKRDGRELKIEDFLSKNDIKELESKAKMK